MLAQMMAVYITCMPMGYMVGKMFVRSLADKKENDREHQEVLDNLDFLPYITAILLPMGTILAIQLIMQGDE